MKILKSNRKALKSKMSEGDRIVPSKGRFLIMACPKCNTVHFTNPDQRFSECPFCHEEIDKKKKKTQKKFLEFFEA